MVGRFSVAAVLALAGALSAATLFTQSETTIGGYQKVSEQRISRTVSRFTYRATLTNTGRLLSSATATVTSLSTATTIVDREVSFGAVPSGGSVVSADTFSFQHDRTVPFDWANLRWTVTPTVANQPPSADAGPDQTAAVGATVTLNGSASSDLDGDPLTYSWRFESMPAGSGASLSASGAVMPTFVVDRPGAYVLRLVVNDGRTDSAPDTVRISTVNSAPVANAGPDQTVFVTNLVTLDGTASNDVDGDALAYAWSFVARPAGSGATLSNPGAARPTFIADKPGGYRVQLVVFDGILSSVADVVEVTTRNTAPVADAGPDQRARVGAMVTLDGSGSSDVDGDPLAYAWSITSAPAGSTAALSSPGAVMPTFVLDRAGTYVVQLIVNDGSGASTPDTAVISTENAAPVANAGPDRSFVAGQLVLLDGSASADPDGDPVTFQWSFATVPPGSAAVLSNPTSIGPSFVADKPGDYVVQLIVHDGDRSSVPDTAVIASTNVTPVADAGPDQSAAVGATAALNGGGSSDADGHPLTYQWSLLSKPAGSAAVLDSPTAAAPTFVADLAGDYVAQLVVNDGFVSSAPDTIVVRASSLPTVSVEATDGTAAEGSTDTGSFTFRRTGASTAPLEVFVAVSGTATNGTDYTPPVGASVTIAAGESSAALQITATDDGARETSETVIITLVTNPAYIVELPGSATVTIADAPNAVPVAVDDAAETVRDTSVDIAVLANDTDADGDALSIEAVSAPANGTVAIVGGAVRYTPNDGFAGSDSFTYQVSDGAGSASATVTVTVRSAAFTLFVSSNKVLPGGSVGVGIVLDAAAGVGGLVAALASSDTSVVAVPDSVVIPEGETYASFDVEGQETLASATVSVTIPGLGTASAAFIVTAQSSGDLIAAALAAGEITEEQAYVYEVFAAAGWPGLPAAYRGGEGRLAIDPHRRLLRSLSGRYASLSPAAQAQVAPLLAPPIYEGSWGDPAALAAADAAATGPAAAAAAGMARFAIAEAETTEGIAPCDRARTLRLPIWGFYQVGQFRIWYISDPSAYGRLMPGAAQSKRVAQIIRDEVAAVYGKLHAVFTRNLRADDPLPLDPDTGVEQCNGGTADYDIYAYGLPGGDLAQTIPYNGATNASYIAFHTPTRLEVGLIKATLAHEMMHAIDFLYDSVDPDKDEWLVEGQATWAETFVYPTNRNRSGADYEWDWAEYFFDEQVIYDGQTVTNAMVPLNALTHEPGDSSRSRIEGSNTFSAYSKYLFFLFLEKRYGAVFLNSILELNERVGSMTAVNEALRASGGFNRAWARFALAAWNDTDAHVQSDFFSWDTGLKHGMYQQFKRGGLYKPITFNLSGSEVREDFPGPKLTKTAGPYVPAAAAQWQHAKFVDDSASIVVLHVRAHPDNDSDPERRFKRMQAIVKSGGTWRAPADLDEYVAWCRDRPEARHKIEEIVLIASNGALPHVGSTLPDWDWVDPADGKELAPKLVVSNAGCWKWIGTAAVTADFEGTSFAGVVQENTITEPVTFELSETEFDSAAASASLAPFRALSGASAEYQVSGALRTDPPCPWTGGPTELPIKPETGLLAIGLIRWDVADRENPVVRWVDASGGETDPIPSTISCPDESASEVPMPFPNWIVVDISLGRLSSDGRAISGTYNHPTSLFGFPVTTVVNLTAVRE